MAYTSRLRKGRGRCRRILHLDRHRPQNRLVVVLELVGIQLAVDDLANLVGAPIRDLLVRRLPTLIGQVKSLSAGADPVALLRRVDVARPLLSRTVTDLHTR